MGLPVIAGTLVKGALVWGATKLIKKAFQKKAAPAEAPAAPTEPAPEPEAPVKAPAPAPPPSVTETSSTAVAQGTAAGIKQRKRAAAANNPLSGGRTPTSKAGGSYAPATLLGR
jgi:hypothetical protein